MKMKTTKKQIKECYTKFIHLADGDCQNLFPEHGAHAYTCGVYGWNFDAFFFGYTAVMRGYRGMFGVMPDNDLCKEYDKKAEELRHISFRTGNNKEYREKLYSLQSEFIKKVFEV